MVIRYAQLKQVMKNKIKNITNMTLSLEKLLFSAGIINIEIFYKVGYLEVYYRIINKNSLISINILFILWLIASSPCSLIV